jgi:Armadillo/beta-catenin-like repeat
MAVAPGAQMHTASAASVSQEENYSACVSDLDQADEARVVQALTRMIQLSESSSNTRKLFTIGVLSRINKLFSSHVSYVSKSKSARTILAHTCCLLAGMPHGHKDLQKKMLESHVLAGIKNILVHRQEVDPVVLEHALRVIWNVAFYFGPGKQYVLKSGFMPILIKHLRETKVPRVATQAAGAIWGVCEGMPAAVTEAIKGGVIEGLIERMQSADAQLSYTAVSALNVITLINTEAHRVLVRKNGLNPLLQLIRESTAVADLAKPSLQVLSTLASHNELKVRETLVRQYHADAIVEGVSDQRLGRPVIALAYLYCQNPAIPDSKVDKLNMILLSKLSEPDMTLRMMVTFCIPIASRGRANVIANLVKQQAIQNIVKSGVRVRASSATQHSKIMMRRFCLCAISSLCSGSKAAKDVFCNNAPLLQHLFSTWEQSLCVDIMETMINIIEDHHDNTNLLLAIQPEPLKVIITFLHKHYTYEALRVVAVSLLNQFARNSSTAAQKIHEIGGEPLLKLLSSPVPQAHARSSSHAQPQSAQAAAHRSAQQKQQQQQQLQLQQQRQLQLKQQQQQQQQRQQHMQQQQQQQQRQRPQQMQVQMQHVPGAAISAADTPMTGAPVRQPPFVAPSTQHQHQQGPIPMQTGPPPQPRVGMQQLPPQQSQSQPQQPQLQQPQRPPAVAPAAPAPAPAPNAGTGSDMDFLESLDSV